MGDDFYMEPKLIQGGVAVDERGEVAFCNDFEFAGVKRFYTVLNHRVGQVRGWHAHKIEHKFVMCLCGASKIVAARLGDDWENPKGLMSLSWVLSDKNPAILHIPAGWANGSMSLRSDTLLIYWSTSTLDQSKGDDFRYDPRTDSFLKIGYPWRPRED